jgi:hypothetical protein
LELERWFSLSGARRNEFLRLLFPDGVFVERQRKGARYGEIEHRLRPRSAEEANTAERFRLGEPQELSSQRGDKESANAVGCK